MKTAPCSCSREAHGKFSCRRPFGCHQNELARTQYSSEVQPSRALEPTLIQSRDQVLKRNQIQQQTTTAIDSIQEARKHHTSQRRGSSLEDSGDDVWCMDDECDRELNVSLTMDSHNITLSPDQDSLNYDDISKHLDASLAEIDMETFQSKDITSALALPGIFSSDGSIEGHLGGENCASISASLLNDFELECSFDPHIMSEDESAEGSNKEPPFSPTKDPLQLNRITMDSLDYTCFDQNNIIVTCQANKSNYVLAFEEDGAKLSDDTHLLVGTEQIKKEVPKPTMITKYRQSQKMYYRPMEQLNAPYTTWGTLKNSKQITRPTFSDKHLRSRSKSLPSLVKQSFIVTENHLGEYGFQINPVKCAPVYELHNSCSGSLQDSKGKNHRNYISLFKLFIKNKTSLASDTCSNSTSSSRFGSLENVLPYDTIQSDENVIVTTSHNTTGHFLEEPQKLQFEKKCDNYRGDLVKSSNVSEYDNGKEIHAILYKRGITTSVKHILNRHPNELNNNIMQTSVDNKFPETDMNRTSSSKKSVLESNDSSSLYFEDSLLEGSLIQHTPTYSSTIQEEEQLDTDSVSGYETMRDSKDHFGSDMSIFEEGPNNFIGCKCVVRRATEGNDTVHRLNNFFFGEKAENGLINNICFPNDRNKLLEKGIELNTESNSHGTQTRRINRKNLTPARCCCDETLSQALPSLSEILNNRRQSRGSRETSPASSGYGGSRQNSLERLRHSSQTFINNSKRISSPVLKGKKNIPISKHKSCGTQIPIHIRDKAIQTSLMSSSGPLESLNVREVCTDSSEDRTSEYFSPSLSSDNSKFSSSSSISNSEKRPVVVYYPNYSLPDLSFLNIFGNKPEEKDLVDVKPNDNVQTAPVSANENQIAVEKNKDVFGSGNPEKLPEKTFNHIKDWDSLNVLLPTKLKSVIPDSCQAKGLDHEHVHKEGIYCNCSGSINSSFTERLKHQFHKDEELSCSGESYSCATTPSSLGSEHPYVNRTAWRKHRAEKTPPPIPKRSLSLPFEKTNLKSVQNDKYRRGILRKSSSVSCSNRQKTHDVACRGISCQLDLRRRNQLEEYTQSLENIPEKISQSENESSCNKNIGSRHEYASSQLQKESKSDHVNYKPVKTSGVDDSGEKYPNSLNNQILFNPVTKAFLDVNYQTDQILNNPSSQLSEQNVNLNQDPKASYSPCNNSSNTDENDQWGSQCCSLNSITSPIHQLCDQLQQFLNSNTSLNLMAAALLAAKGSPEAVNSCSSSSSSNYPREKKSVTFHDLAPVSHINKKNINDVTEKNPKVEIQECLTGETNSEEESDSPPLEFAVSPQQRSSSSLTLSSDINNFPDPVDILTQYFKNKTDLLNKITEAVEQLLTDQTDHENQKEKVLKYLCPALYNILANGLLSSEPGFTTFSPWTVIEACSWLGHQPKELQDLVKLIDGSDNIGGRTYKFYVFVFGLLNLGIVDWWFLHLISSESLLRQYYKPDALLCLLASPLAKKLCEDILIRLRPLSSLSFSLDLNIRRKYMDVTDENPSSTIPLTFPKECNVIQAAQFEPTGYQCGVIDKEKDSHLLSSKKNIHPTSHASNLSSKLYSIKKPSKAFPLHISGKKDTAVRQEKPVNNEVLKTNYLQKKKQTNNNYEKEAAVKLEPVEGVIDKAWEINSSVQIYTDSAKDSFQRAVDLAFPSTATREREARGLCILTGDTHCKKRHDTDLFYNNTERENRCKNIFQEKNNKFSKIGSKNKQTGEMENSFKGLKLKWEEFISSPNSDGKNPTRTVTPTMFKELPLQSKPIVDQLSGISGSPRLSQKTATTRKVKKPSSTSSHSETFSKKQTSVHNKHSPKQLFSKEPVKGSAVTKPPRGSQNPTIKQVIAANNMPAVSTNQKGVVSTPCSPSRKPNPKRALGNVNWSASNSSNSLSASGSNESKQNTVRKSLIPVQRDNRASSGQQRRTAKPNAVPLSRY